MNAIALMQGKMTRPKMARLEALLRQLPPLPSPSVRTRHYFAPGIYARELFIPAGACLIGLRHRDAGMSFCLGDITVATEDGPKRVTGYQVVNAPAGVKRAAVTHSDTWWTTIHPNPTNERDVEKLAAMFVMDELEVFE